MHVDRGPAPANRGAVAVRRDRLTTHVRATSKTGSRTVQVTGDRTQSQTLRGRSVPRSSQTRQFRPRPHDGHRTPHSVRGRVWHVAPVGRRMLRPRRARQSECAQRSSVCSSPSTPARLSPSGWLRHELRTIGPLGSMSVALSASISWLQPRSGGPPPSSWSYLGACLPKKSRPQRF